MPGPAPRVPVITAPAPAGTDLPVAATPRPGDPRGGEWRMSALPWTGDLMRIPETPLSPGPLELGLELVVGTTPD